MNDIRLIGRDDRWIISLAFVICLFLWDWGSAKAAGNERFPSKTIKVIIPNSPGGATDTEPRWFVPYLGKQLGVNVLIENLPGADTKIGLTKGWHAKPDGYTLLYHGVPQSLMTEYIYKPDFKTLDFTHIFGLYTSTQVLCGHSDDWKNIEDFIKDARSKTLAGGTSSRGSTSHINGLILTEKFGIKVNWVFYNSTGEALAALAGKHLDFAIMSPETIQPMVAAGKVKPLLVFADKPDQTFPAVPFPNKLGYDMSTILAIRGFIAPPNLTAARKKILEQAMVRATRELAYMEWAKKWNKEIAALEGSRYLEETKKQHILLEKYKRFFTNP